MPNEKTHAVRDADSARGVSYIVVEWRHGDVEDPTILYSELDEGRCETRKVDVYANGRMDFADAERQTGTTWLAEGGLMSIEEINSHDPFTARDIAKDDFERVWTEARSRHTSG